MTPQLKTGAVVFAKNVARVAKFYQEILAMTALRSEQGRVVLDAPDHQLVVHAVPDAIAATITIATPPKRRTDVATKLFFAVASISEARAKAIGLGGGLDPAGDEWEAAEFRACDGHDPEGNVVQFRESARHSAG